MAESKLVNADIESEFFFETGGMTCNCKGFEEFVENAFGHTKYELIMMQISQYDLKNKESIYCAITESGISILSSDKRKLEKLVSFLDNKPQKTTDTYIENQYNIGDISGEHNNININQGENNTIQTTPVLPEINKNKIESKSKSWFESIIQNLLSNWIWYLLATSVAFIVGYFTK